MKPHFNTEMQIEELRKLRNGYEFDALEKMFHCSSIKGVSEKLFIKIAEAKIKNKKIDVSEQEKMIEYLDQADRWVNMLHRKFENQSVMISDLMYLNKKLIEKI